MAKALKEVDEMQMEMQKENKYFLRKETVFKLKKLTKQKSKLMKKKSKIHKDDGKSDCSDEEKVENKKLIYDFEQMTMPKNLV